MEPPSPTRTSSSSKTPESRLPKPASLNTSAGPGGSSKTRPPPQPPGDAPSSPEGTGRPGTSAAHSSQTAAAFTSKSRAKAASTWPSLTCTAGPEQPRSARPRGWTPAAPSARTRPSSTPASRYSARRSPEAASWFWVETSTWCSTQPATASVAPLMATCEPKTCSGTAALACVSPPPASRPELQRRLPGRTRTSSAPTAPPGWTTS